MKNWELLHSIYTSPINTIIFGHLLAKRELSLGWAI